MYTYIASTYILYVANIICEAMIHEKMHKFSVDLPICTILVVQSKGYVYGILSFFYISFVQSICLLCTSDRTPLDQSRLPIVHTYHTRHVVCRTMPQALSLEQLGSSPLLSPTLSFPLSSHLSSHLHSPLPSPLPSPLHHSPLLPSPLHFLLSLPHPFLPYPLLAMSG